MNHYKAEILDKICYTDLVYERINKKLNTQLSKDEIETLVFEVLQSTNEADFQKTGKNIYVTHKERGIRITINSFTFRIITVDALIR